MKFQFLIGSLKSVCLQGWLWKENWFQFLIGSLKSLILGKIKTPTKKVSIPYRQSKISQADRQREENCRVSIPYRQSKITNAQIQNLAVDTAFQFLIGSLKSCLSITCPDFNAGVSIPYRQSKILSSICTACITSSCFNSLQVV